MRMKTIFLAVAALLASPSAFAGDIDFSRHILDLDGKDVPTDKDGPPLDLRRVAETASLVPPKDDPRVPMSPDVKLSQSLMHADLAFKIHAANPIAHLDSGEITLLKQEIAQVWPPLIVKRAVEILDPPPSEGHPK